MVGEAETPSWARIARFGFGVLGLVALVWIPFRSGNGATFSLANYLSYFTIESNIFGVVVLLVGGIVDPGNRRWQVIRGAAALYLLITGVVYAVLLANIDVMLTDRWINDVLHRVLPIVLFVDWVLVPAGLDMSEGRIGTAAVGAAAGAERQRGAGIGARLIGSLLIYPAVFGVYSLIRGAIVHWYPYPFLDPREQGYPSLLLGLVVLAMVFALLAAAVLLAGRLAARRT